MRNFEQKKGWRNIAESKPVLALLGIVILVFTWNILNFWKKMEETADNKKLAEAKVAGLTEDKEKLSSDIGTLETEEGKERIFRENYGLAKDGEDLIVIVDDKPNPASPQSRLNSFFSFFKNLFK